MLAIEDRLKYLEDRIGLQDAFFSYLAEVDSMSDIDGLLDSYTEDSVLDLTALNLPKIIGHADIRKFFTMGFADKTHLAHFVTNFRVRRLAGDNADCSANLMTTWKDKTGAEWLAYLQCELSYVRSENRWKFGRFAERYLMPVIRRSEAVS